MPPTEIASRITVDPDVSFGKPVIAGSRVPVATVVGHLAAGDSIELIMEEFTLAREDVLAALSYAASAVANDQVRAVK